MDTGTLNTKTSQWTQSKGFTNAAINKFKTAVHSNPKVYPTKSDSPPTFD